MDGRSNPPLGGQWNSPASISFASRNQLAQQSLQLLRVRHCEQPAGAPREPRFRLARMPGGWGASMPCDLVLPERHASASRRGRQYRQAVSNDTLDDCLAAQRATRCQPDIVFAAR
jgi:hypothetical protein